MRDITDGTCSISLCKYEARGVLLRNNVETATPTAPPPSFQTGTGVISNGLTLEIKVILL